MHLLCCGCNAILVGAGINNHPKQNDGYQEFPLSDCLNIITFSILLSEICWEQTISQKAAGLFYYRKGKSIL